MLKKVKELGEIEELNKEKILKFLFVLLFSSIILVIPVNFYVGKTNLAIIELISTLISIISIIIFTKRNNVVGKTWVLTCYLILFSLLPSYLNTHYTAYTLTIGSMIVLFVIQGYRKGLYINLSIFVLTIPGYIYKINHTEDVLPVAVHINFLMIYIVLFIISIFNESIKHKYKSVIQNLIDELSELSIIDNLTKLNNRRSLELKLKDEWSRHKRCANSLSVLICDIDFFKSYNNILGPQEGDKCLIKISEVLTQSVQREIDFVSRYSGEKFVILLPQADEETAKNVALKIMNRLSNLNITNLASDTGNVTLSIGGSTMFPSDNNSYEELIKSAYEALYLSKKNGRNRYTNK